jgi:hypothetical protein
VETELACFQASHAGRSRIGRLQHLRIAPALTRGTVVSLSVCGAEPVSVFWRSVSAAMRSNHPRLVGSITLMDDGSSLHRPLCHTLGVCYRVSTLPLMAVGRPAIVRVVICFSGRFFEPAGNRPLAGSTISGHRPTALPCSKVRHHADAGAVPASPQTKASRSRR